MSKATNVDKKEEPYRIDALMPVILFITASRTVLRFSCWIISLKFLFFFPGMASSNNIIQPPHKKQTERRLDTYSFSSHQENPNQHVCRSYGHNCKRQTYLHVFLRANQAVMLLKQTAGKDVSCGTCGKNVASTTSPYQSAIKERPNA